MNIGILTYHCVPNFGAQLQALSTIGFVKRMGHNPVLLHWYPKDLEEMYDKRIPMEQIACHTQFAKESFPLSKLCRNEDDLLEEIKSNELDFIITGSDALFKYIPKANRRVFSKRKLRYIDLFSPLSVEDFPGNPFFCDYYDRLDRKMPVIAFSVSSQNCPYNKMSRNERKQIGGAMSNFKAITVRDEWTKQMVEHLTGRKDIQITPDPVFAFNSNCYISVPSKSEVLKKFELPENYVLLSFSDWFIKADYVKGISEELVARGYVPVALPMPEALHDFGIEHRIKLPLSPIDWYALIKYSKGYIGERMHPIVVSLHNSIPVYCFDEYGIFKESSWFNRKKTYLPESSKTYHIMSRFDLLDNLYSYKGGKEIPSAKEVVDKLISFDVNKCTRFSQLFSNSFCDNLKKQMIL